MRRLIVGPILGMLLLASMLVASATAVLADPRDFTLENASEVVISHLYVSPADMANWGDDILGRDVLGPGETGNVTFSGFTPDACSYDIMVLAVDGREGYLYGVDLCSVSWVSFS